MIMNLETGITHNPLQCGGKPYVRNPRVRVSDILQMLGEGVSSEKIFAGFSRFEAASYSGLSVVCRPPGKF